MFRANRKKTGFLHRNNRRKPTQSGQLGTVTPYETMAILIIVAITLRTLADNEVRGWDRKIGLILVQSSIALIGLGFAMLILPQLITAGLNHR